MFPNSIISIRFYLISIAVDILILYLNIANTHEHGRVLDGDNGTLGISHHESVCGTESMVCEVRSALKT